jgi:hypothetical protein
VTAVVAVRFFWSRVDRTDGCWEWRGWHTKAGYGQFRFNPSDRQAIYAHRFSFELHYRPLESGEEVMHTCDNPPCVNPAHLRAGSHAQNMADMARKGRGVVPQPRPGELHHAAKLTDAQVYEIRARCAAGEDQRAIARDYGVRNTTISMIHNRHTWKHL